MSRTRHRRRARPLLRAWRPAGLALAAAVLAAACGVVTVTEAPATPTDFPGLAGRLAASGISLGTYVSGDPGCTDPDLLPTAIRFDASGLDQATPVTIYLYVFRNRDAFERHRAQVGPCARAYVTDAQTFESIEESPYILAGQGPWAPAFETSLRAVVAAAAGTGG